MIAETGGGEKGRGWGGGVETGSTNRTVKHLAVNFLSVMNKYLKRQNRKRS